MKKIKGRLRKREICFGSEKNGSDPRVRFRVEAILMARKNRQPDEKSEKEDFNALESGFRLSPEYDLSSNGFDKTKVALHHTLTHFGSGGIN